MTYFISDTHFGHANIIRYCSRPFSSVEEMDDAMIRRWNATVSPNDTVYHIGDFAFGNTGRIRHYREQLNGSIYLVTGNHDRHRPSVYLSCGFHGVWKKRVVDSVDGVIIEMSHRAENLLDLNDNQRQFISWQLFGHTHNHGPKRLPSGAINCSVEHWNYTPRTLAELTALQ